MTGGVFDAGESARTATDGCLRGDSFSTLLTGVTTLKTAGLGGVEELARLTRS